MLLRNKSISRCLPAACSSAKNYVILVIFLCSSYNSYAQVNGCPDPAANNYNNTVTVNDGSCTYNDVFIKPVFNFNLNTKVNETSGLIWWNNQVWTHNDSGGDPALYAVNTDSGKIVKKVAIRNATNVDWEDIAQDDTYIYIGDFGNNINGNRQDLKIYRVSKSDVISKTAAKASVINFSYDDQTDFTPTGSNNTNFDCEALIAYGDNLYLFSKDWIDNKTRLYKLPKTPGTYTAVNIGELDVQGLITGTDVIADKRVIVLSGYNSTVTPFIYLLYDFTGNLFFGANKRKAGISQSFLQAEGICAKSDTTFYMSNERLQTSFFTTKAKLQTLNLSGLLTPYYNALAAKTTTMITYNKVQSNKKKNQHASK